jgi:DNA-binding response OmpR family regulator
VKTGTILIVDDNAMNVEMLQVHFELEGYSILTAHSGEEALRKLEKMPADAVLLDVNLGGIDGLETCERIKANPATAHIPVAVMTGFDGDDIVKNAIRVGAQDVFQKPFYMGLLILRIGNLIRLHQLENPQ